jgi:hypothetical protein
VVVVTVTEKFAAVPADGVTVEGDTEQLAYWGAPVHARFTVLEKPAASAMLRLKVAVPPLLTVAEVAPPCGVPIVMAGVPLPVSATDCGFIDALSAMVSVPVRAPVADGVNTTAMLQVFPAARLEPQVLVSEKSPVTVIPEMLSGA